jgi:hypothetical protein
LKSRLLRVLCTGYLLCLFHVVTAQEVIFDSTNQFWYNPFDNNSLGNVNYLVSGSANKTIVLTSTSNTSFNNTIALTSVNGVNVKNNLNGSILGPTDRNLNSYDYEWTFLYKNNSTTSPVEAYNNGSAFNSNVQAGPSNGQGAWRYWLNASTNDNTTTDITGFYLTHVGGNMIFRYRGGEYDIQSLITFPISNNVIYAIKVQRLTTGRWIIYANPITTNAEPTTYIGQTDQGAVNTYSYTLLECTDLRTSGNNFYWDNLKMYTRRISFKAINSATNGITQSPLIAGQANVVLYGLQMYMRGYYPIYDLNLSTTGVSLNAYLTNGRIYKSIDDLYSTTTDNTLLANPVLDMSSNTVQSGSLNGSTGDMYSTSGSTDGSSTRVADYYLVADVLSTLNYGSTPYGTIQFTGPSQVRTADYQNGITYTNSASTGNNVIAFANTIDWTGASDNNWNNTGNWSPATVPTSTDAARIGVVSFKNQPIVQSSVPSIAAMIFGPLKSTLFGSPSITLTINTTYSLTVNGAITQYHNSSTGDVTTTITGSGTAALSCSSFVVGDNTTPPAPTIFSSPVSNTTTINTTIPVFNITNSLSLNTTSSAIGYYALGFLQNYSVNNAAFHLNLGSLTVSNIAITNLNYVNRNDGINTITNAALVDMDTGTGASTLTLTGNTPLSVATGGAIDFTTGGSGTGLVNYAAASGTQTVYATSDSFIGATPSNYDNLTLSGAAAKTVDGGALTISGNWITSGGAINLNTNNPIITTTGTWTNSANVTQGSGNITITGATSNSSVITGASGTLTFTGTYSNSSGSTISTGSGTATFTGAYTNTAAGTFTAGSGSVIFNSDYTSTGTFTPGAGTVFFSKAGAQSLTDNSTNGTKFNNVTINGSNTKTMSGTGKFAVSSSGKLTMGGTATLAAGGVLTLNSDATGSATVDAIPSGTAITGNVNVQRFISGGNSYNRGYRLLSSPVNTGAPIKVISVNYLKNSSWITGTTGTTGGFDKSGNPTIYCFRENLASSQVSFTAGNFRGINNINSSPTYVFDADGSHTIPVGNGLLFFFRGDRTAADLATSTTASYVPTSTTFTTTGTLNTGNITVTNWYSGTTNLLFSNTTGSLVNGYNLVGNPYAATINWEKFNRRGTTSTVSATSSIYGAGFPSEVSSAATLSAPGKIWVYNPKTKQYSSYMQKATTLTLPADTSTSINPGISSDGYASNMIASGQAFFIQATSASQSLTFRESAKSTTQPTASNLIALLSTPADKGLQKLASTAAEMNILKAAEAQSAVSQQTSSPSTEPILRLQMIKDSINTDDIVLAFNNNVSAAFENNKDAEDLGSNGAQIALSALSSDSVKTVIHHRPFPKKQQEVIPLTSDATTSGPYQLKVREFSNIPAIYEVWLKDNFTKDSLNIKQDNVYSYNIDKGTPATFGKNRFQLVLRQSPELALHLVDFKAIKATEGAKTTWIVENEASYTTFNLQRSIDNGKTWEDLKVMQSEGLGTYSYTDPNPAKGLNKYRVQLTDLNNDISLSKELPLMYANTQNNLSNSLLTIYPNPVKETINLTISQTNQSANYNIQLTNSSGMILKTVNITQLTWKNNVGSFVPGTYIIRVIDNKTKQLIGTSKFVKL